MLNMTAYFGNQTADNEVIINGATFKVSDEVTKTILDIITGRTTAKAVDTPQAVTPQTPASQPKAEKSSYSHKKDLQAQYQIQYLTGTDGTQLYCISRKNGWTKAEKHLMNSAIKALKGIKTISVEYTDKNGKTRTYNAWGYNTESTAKKHLKELPTVFTVDQLNGVSL